MRLACLGRRRGIFDCLAPPPASGATQSWTRGTVGMEDCYKGSTFDRGRTQNGKDVSFLCLAGEKQEKMPGEKRDG